MKNRLRFRVWSKYSNTYVTSNECAIDCNGVLFDSNDGRAFGSDYIVEQCTGLIDKNGKLIFEGDIVKTKPTNEKRVIEFNMGKFGSNKECGFYSLGNWTRPVEIIGNKHEETK